MLLEGTIAELVIKLDPQLYRKYIWKNKHDKPMLYIKLKRALYGTLQAALLFWRLLLTTFKEWGFKLNEYDQCIANKTINSKQCSITWRVDDLKISHVKKRVVEMSLSDLMKNLEKKVPYPPHEVMY